MDIIDKRKFPNKRKIEMILEVKKTPYHCECLDEFIDDLIKNIEIIYEQCKHPETLKEKIIIE